LLNAHSINILGLHIANMDIQFILGITWIQVLKL